MEAESVTECPAKCTQAANGIPGCCEWQEDWKVCVFVPDETIKPADGNRAATKCSMYNVIHDSNRFDRYSTQNHIKYQANYF